MRMERAHTAIIIATKNRPEIFAETLQSIYKQTHVATAIYVSVSSLADAPAGNFPERRYRAGRIDLEGAPSAIPRSVKCLSDVQYIAFFDDDVELHPSYLEHAVNFLERNPDVVAISGIMIADGNISREAARAPPGPGHDLDERSFPAGPWAVITFSTPATRSSEAGLCGRRCSTKTYRFTVMAKTMIYRCA